MISINEQRLKPESWGRQVKENITRVQQRSKMNYDQCVNLGQEVYILVSSPTISAEKGWSSRKSRIADSSYAVEMGENLYRTN
jgi:hypothetical protein